MWLPPTSAPCRLRRAARANGCGFPSAARWNTGSRGADDETLESLGTRRGGSSIQRSVLRVRLSWWVLSSKVEECGPAEDGGEELAMQVRVRRDD
ncbi:MAG: hypothetical protein QG597_3487, partial [Actinomycetota bacterium]|nr:hypothetical protein [Actinomycetota bacterium]